MQVEASAPEWAACPPPISSQRKCKECTATGGLPRPGQGTRWEVSGLRVRMNAEEGRPGGPAECQNPSRLQLGGVRLGSPGHGMQHRVPPCAQARLALGRSDWACLPAPGRGDLEEGAARVLTGGGRPRLRCRSSRTHSPPHPGCRRLDGRGLVPPDLSPAFGAARSGFLSAASAVPQLPRCPSVCPPAPLPPERAHPSPCGRCVLGSSRCGSRASPSAVPLFFLAGLVLSRGPVSPPGPRSFPH